MNSLDIITIYLLFFSTLLIGGLNVLGSLFENESFMSGSVVFHGFVLDLVQHEDL